MSDTNLEKAAQLGASDHLNSIPDLAEMDRKATGWLRITLGGLLGLGIGLVWLLLQLAVIGYILSLLLPILMDFSLSVFPYWWYANGQTGGTPYWYSALRGGSLEELRSVPPQGDWQIWAGLLAATAFFLVQSKGVRARLQDLALWPSSDLPVWPLRLLIQAARGLTWAAILLWNGGFIAMALMALVRFGRIAASLAEIASENWVALSSLAERFWYYPAGAALLLALLIYMLRNRLKGHILRTLVVILSAIGLADIGLQILQLANSSWAGWMMTAGLILMLVYPAGLAVPLARLVVPPFNTLRNTLHWIYQNTRLRILLGRGLAAQRKRNLRQTQGRIWATVCRTDRVRFEAHTVRLSYGRWLTYGSCPVCGDDHAVYNRVDCIALAVDESMPERIRQSGPVLWLNGLDWLNAPQDAALPVFDAVVIGQADKHLIEGMVVRYKSQPLSPRHRLLKQITVRLAMDSSIDQNTRRILDEHFASVLPGYDQPPDRSPATRSWETHDTLQKQASKVKVGFQRAGCAVLVAGAAFATAAGVYIVSPEAREWMFQGWLQLQPLWEWLALNLFY